LLTAAHSLSAAGTRTEVSALYEFGLGNVAVRFPAFFGRPSGTSLNFLSYPALKRGAKLDRPFGAGFCGRGQLDV